jgi:FixJ family two-component response regulator
LNLSGSLRLPSRNLRKKQRFGTLVALGDARWRIGSLSPREREVLEMVIAGLLSKQIARRLEITERTVKAHRHSLMEKTEVDSVAELVELALIAGVEPKH